MPYKDPDKRREASRKWAAKNKEKQAPYRADRKKAIKQWFEEYKSDKSCPCGESHPACLEFHHTDEDNKYSSVSFLVQKGYSLDKIKAEIDKCIILCANCHRKLHYEEKSGSHKPERNTRKNKIKSVSEKPKNKK